MAAYQKELEIVYDLQWKTKGGVNGNNGDDKANIVGIYDTPNTTLNLETFKSYLVNIDCFFVLGVYYKVST